MSSSTEPRMRVRSNSSSVRSTSPYPSSSSFTASSARPTIKTPPSSSSAWQQLVVHASSAAGSTAAVISEESMKCLKYCLSWLQYAMRHIEQQMNVLRDFLVSLASSQQQQQHSLAPHHPNNNMHRSHLSSIKKDIVDTLRKVVDVISRYASNSLPHQAKMAVRGFILDLPGRCVRNHTLTFLQEPPFYADTCCFYSIGNSEWHSFNSHITRCFTPLDTHKWRPSSRTNGDPIINVWSRIRWYASIRLRCLFRYCGPCRAVVG